MKKTSLALAGLALICAVPAFADNTDTATVTVSGNIVAPLTLAVPTNVTLPTIVRPKTGGADNTVEMTCASATPSYVYSAGATPFAAGSTSQTGIAAASKNLTTPAPAAVAGTCAVVNVTGQDGYFFLTTVGASTTTGAPAGITIGAANCSTTSGSTVISGTTSIYCGASVTVTDASTAATYAGSFPVTVTYD